MKNFILTILFVFSMSALFAQTNDNPDVPVLKFEKESINYGTIKKGEDGSRVFKFKNIGKSPLKIERVKSSCGCTVPTYPKKEIMPGETGEISVKYDTNKVGRFSKTISIFSNAKRKRIVLRISGNVVTP